MVGPLALALEARGDRIAAIGLLFESEGVELGVSDHQVPADHHHLGDVLPILVQLFLALAEGGIVDGVLRLDDMLADPFDRFLELDGIIDLFSYPPLDFTHVHDFGSHAKVRLKEILVDNRAGDSHRHPSDREVALSSHLGDRQTGFGEAENLLLDILGNRGVRRVLNIPAVDAEGGEAFLGVGGKNRRKVHRAGAFGAVEAPDRLDRQRIHVEGLRSVAPARGNGQGYSDPFLFELLGAIGALAHSADRGVGDDALHLFTVRVAKIVADELRCGLGHIHRLLFQRLANAPLAPVDDRTDSDLRKL
ncbi:MAG: hypothetical protein BWY50_02036 [Spirochaetes bacterium ADurb.Bin315]|nr:MAG: hypothetical protein BWY50_02036 [Spirochaetes bacterium ADurb.Bin315]